MTAATWERILAGSVTVYHRATMREGGWIIAAPNDDMSWRWAVYAGPADCRAEGTAPHWSRARALAEAAATNLGFDVTKPPATVRISVDLDDKTCEALVEYRAVVNGEAHDLGDLLTDRIVDLALALLDRLDERADELGH